MQRKTGCNSSGLCFLSYCCLWRLFSARGVELVAWAIMVIYFIAVFICFGVLVFFVCFGWGFFWRAWSRYCFHKRHGPLIGNLSTPVLSLLSLIAFHGLLGSLPWGLQEVSNPWAGDQFSWGWNFCFSPCKASSVPSVMPAPQPA